MKATMNNDKGKGVNRAGQSGARAQGSRVGQADRLRQGRPASGKPLPAPREADLRDEARKSRIRGFLLIGVGSLSLLLTLMFSGIPALSAVPEKISRMWTNMASRFKVWIYGPEKEPSPWDFSDVKPLEELKAVPSAHGWSALDSFYASHPAVEGEEEYYLDPALWREPARAGKKVPAGPVSVAGGSDTVAMPAAPAQRTGLWTGPADGTLVDTSIRPLREQLKRQGAMPLQNAVMDSVVSDSTAAVGLAVAGDDTGVSAAAESAAGGQAPADAPTSQKPLHVEFWESPVHYKGYQLSGNNLILYGINDSDSLRFENHPDGVWMYHKEAVYRLTASSEMQRFELISGTSSLEEPGMDEFETDSVTNGSDRPDGSK